MVVLPSVLYFSTLLSLVSALDFRPETHHRHLQNCVLLHGGRAIECVQSIVFDGSEIRYTIPCGTNADSVQACLTDQTRICYQWNSTPCLKSYYCEAEGRFYLDCRNIFSAADGASCGATDCSGNCVSPAPNDVVAYSEGVTDNACTFLGFLDVQECPSSGPCKIVNEWTDILGDGTKIHVTTEREEDSNIVGSCAVRAANDGSCICHTDCSSQDNALIRYDCSEHSDDKCAVKDCQGNCLNAVVLDEATPTSLPASTEESTFPSDIPSGQPSFEPSPIPSYEPSSGPSTSFAPSDAPSSTPSETPSVSPSLPPSTNPTHSTSPSAFPSVAPSSLPSSSPSSGPSFEPSSLPSASPTQEPSFQPSYVPSEGPSFAPTLFPTQQPTETPTAHPTPAPTVAPTESPTKKPAIPVVPVNFPTSFGTPVAIPSGSPPTEPTNQFPVAFPFSFTTAPIPVPVPTAPVPTAPVPVPVNDPVPVPVQAPVPVPLQAPSPTSPVRVSFGFVGNPNAPPPTIPALAPAGQATILANGPRALEASLATKATWGTGIVFAAVLLFVN